MRHDVKVKLRRIKKQVRGRKLLQRRDRIDLPSYENPETYGLPTGAESLDNEFSSKIPYLEEEET